MHWHLSYCQNTLVEFQIVIVSNPSRKHLIKEQREIKEVGLLNSSSTRTITKRLKVSPSIVIQDFKANRTLKEKNK